MFICRQATNLVTIPIAFPRLHPPCLQGNQHSYSLLRTDGQQDEEREPAEKKASHHDAKRLRGFLLSPKLCQATIQPCDCESPTIFTKGPSVASVRQNSAVVCSISSRIMEQRRSGTVVRALKFEQFCLCTSNFKSLKNQCYGQNRSSEADYGSTSHEIHRLLEYPVVHYRDHTDPLTGLCHKPEEFSTLSHNLHL